MNGEPAPSAAGIGAAVATLIWTLLGGLTTVGDKLGDAGLAACTGATAIIVGGILYFVIPGKPKT